MGRRNRDRYTLADWKLACPNVGAMRRANWLITSVCPRCDLEIEANLELMEREVGPDFVLWGKTTTCRRRFCEGEAAFFVQPPGATVEHRMTA